jgi:hypothetical protein
LSVAGATLAARRLRAKEAALEDSAPSALRSALPAVVRLESVRCVAIAGRTINQQFERFASIGFGEIASYQL